MSESSDTSSVAELPSPTPTAASTMPETPAAAHLQPIAPMVSRVLPPLSAAACFLFGIALIANSHLACEGVWYWYATLHNGGKRLYADMHLVLQPLAVLEASWWMAVAGKGWVISKVPAVLHLLGFCTGIALVTAKSRLSEVQKALMLLCVFFVGIHFEAYRFDDYHVMVHVPVLFSILLLLKLDEEQSREKILPIAAALGVLSGLATATRLTDGAALCVCTVAAAASIARSRRLALVATICGCAVLTVVAAVSLTGDSFRDYVSNTMLHAAGPKGGLEQVLLSPLMLLWNAELFLQNTEPRRVVALTILATASWTFLVRPFLRAKLAGSVIRAVIGLSLIAYSLIGFRRALHYGYLIYVLAAVWVILTYVLGLLVAPKVVMAMFRPRLRPVSNPKQTILLLPLGQLAAGAASSGAQHWGLYIPVALLLLTLPAVYPAVFARERIRSSFLFLATLMTFFGVYYRIVNPVSWQSFRSFPMFSQRIILHHPTHGPMIVDAELNAFFSQICSTMKANGRKTELASIPLPYANYYCDIPPWQGFVQTFFDTASKDDIDRMMVKLEQSPPQWVLYQRQLDTLALHEMLFNKGYKLPQRPLDDFIMKKIGDGQWHVVFRRPYGWGNDWILVKTD